MRYNQVYLTFQGTYLFFLGTYYDGNDCMKHYPVPYLAFFVALIYSWQVDSTFGLYLHPKDWINIWFISFTFKGPGVNFIIKYEEKEFIDKPTIPILISSYLKQNNLDFQVSKSLYPGNWICLFVIFSLLHKNIFHTSSYSNLCQNQIPYSKYYCTLYYIKCTKLNTKFTNLK